LGSYGNAATHRIQYYHHSRTMCCTGHDVHNIIRRILASRSNGGECKQKFCHNEITVHCMADMQYRFGDQIKLNEATFRRIFLPSSKSQNCNKRPAGGRIILGYSFSICYAQRVLFLDSSAGSPYIYVNEMGKCGPADSMLMFEVLIISEAFPHLQPAKAWKKLLPRVRTNQPQLDD